MRYFSTLIFIISLMGVACSEKTETHSATDMTSPINIPKSESKTNTEVETKNVSATTEVKPEEPKKKETIKLATKPETETPTPNSKPENSGLAELEERINHVDYRARNESIWSHADIGKAFMRFDALQTQSASSAKVQYKSGSKLEVRENTLLVFDHDPGKAKKNEDRVIVKNGGLIGSTKTELWVFTNAGLVQIKPTKDSKLPARAQVAIKNGNQLNVKVDAGAANVIVKNENKFEKIEVATKSEVTVESKVALLESSTNSNEIKVTQMTEAAETVKAPTKTDLVIESPQDDISVNTDSYEVKGHLTGPAGKLLINGNLIALSDKYAFSKIIDLQPGSNLIVFQLIRSDSTVQFARKTIRKASK